jgi:hypothetical protein
MRKKKEQKLNSRTNKEIIFETIKFMKDNSTDITKESFFNLPMDIWAKLNPPLLDTQRMDDIRALMLRSLLIHLTDNLWVARLTAGGLVALNSDFNDDGSQKVDKELEKQLKIANSAQIRGAIAGAALTGLITLSITYIPKLIHLMKPKENKSNMVVFPKKAPIPSKMHDTIYLKMIK